MLRYKETNWKNSNGLATHSYTLNISSVRTSETRKEQQTRLEKISLVSFLNKEQKKGLVNICRRLKRNNSDFYQNSNLHVTLFGFGLLKKEVYSTIQKRILQFSNSSGGKLTIRFDSIRPGTMYTRSQPTMPIDKLSNGTVIAFGDVGKNQDFCNYANSLGSYLLQDSKTKTALGHNFRRKFPTVWCTLGYYNKIGGFKIGKHLEAVFNDLQHLDGPDFNNSISEISLVKSRYKNLRYPKLIQKYRL